MSSSNILDINNMKNMQYENQLEKYKKMREILPEGAVRQKMSIDGFSETEIEYFFSGQVGVSQVSQSTIESTLSRINKQYEKYNKMREMLPEEVVRQKMVVDGIDKDEIDNYFNA